MHCLDRPGASCLLVYPKFWFVKLTAIDALVEVAGVGVTMTRASIVLDVTKKSYLIHMQA